MQISGADYGPAVPSGVFCVRRVDRGWWHHRRVIVPEPALAPDAIRAARDGIDPVFLDSPQFVHDGLSARLGVPVIVKVETVNPIRSFKGRGTWVAVHALAGEGRIGPERPIACVSAGNFGQGVAYAARALGIPAIVFTSVHANPRKVARMQALGAEVIGVGEDFDAAARHRRRTPPRTRSNSSSTARIHGSRPARPRSRSR